MTDKIEFDIIPPSVTATSPAPLSRRPTVGSPECADKSLGFHADYFNASDSTLEWRLVSNGLLVESGKVRGTTGSLDVCAPFDRYLGNEGVPSAPECYEVVLYVSHAFEGGFSMTRPSDTVVEGDLDSVTWFVGVESPDTTAEDPTPWSACLSAATPTPTPTLEGQLLDGGEAP